MAGDKTRQLIPGSAISAARHVPAFADAGLTIQGNHIVHPEAEVEQTGDVITTGGGGIAAVITYVEQQLAVAGRAAVDGGKGWHRGCHDGGNRECLKLEVHFHY